MPPTIVEPKPGIDMGRVVASIRVENAEDRRRAKAGEIPESQVRAIETEALVDSGATFFCMPESMIRQLGLFFDRDRETKTITGPLVLKIYAGARLEIMERGCNVEVMAIPENRQVLLGQIPLETLDFWIDMTNKRLVGNPEHDGEWMAEAY